MRIKQSIYIYAFAALLLGGCKSNNELTIPTNLRTEYLTEPIGLDTSSPRFTWEYSGNEEGFKASRYEVRIGTSPDDLRPYAEGMALKPHTRYYWTGHDLRHRSALLPVDRGQTPHLCRQRPAPALPGTRRQFDQ